MIMDMKRGIILLTSVYGLVNFVLSQEFNNSDLEFIVLVQKEFCGSHTLCNPEYAESLKETTRSLDDLPISPSDYIAHDCCRNCSCDRSTCRDIGNCCPDIMDRLPSLEEAIQPKKVSCKTVSLKVIGDFTTYWLYNRCSNGFEVHGTNKEKFDVKSKCENPDEYFDFDTKQPVVDRTTQRTYSNRYCALCDLVEDRNMIPFKTGVRCYDGASFFKSVNIETIVEDVLSTESCDLEFYWPDDLVDFIPPRCRDIEVGCNITGNWVKYDPFIEEACYSYRARYNYKYNNVFCYMCNELEYAYQCTDEIGRGFAAVSFAAVLDFNRIPEKEAIFPTRCTENQVLDNYKGVCRNVSCVFPRILQKGQCVSLISNMIEVAYMLQLKFTPLSQQKGSELPDAVVVIEDYVRSLMELWNVFNATADSRFFHASSLIFVEQDSFADIMPVLNEDDTLSRSPNDDIDDPMTTSSAPTTSSPFERRKRETENDTEIEMEINLPTSDIELPPRLKTVEIYIDYILWQVRWYFKYNVVQPHSSNFIANVLDLNNINTSLDNPINNKSFSFSLSVEDYELNNYNFPIDPIRKTTLMAYPSFIYLPQSHKLNPIYAIIQKIKPTMTCPLVKIEDSEYNITEISDGIYVEELNDTFYKSYIETIDAGSDKIQYLICTDKFLEVTQKYTLDRTNTSIVDNGITMKGVLSVVFSCISVLCAMLTLITYALFEDFRTQPGVNNMYLCVYLMCAQSLFTFATPQEKVVSELVCSILGALTHFFWLMVIFAMNVCCFHMVTVFKGQLKNRANRRSKSFKSFMYNSYCAMSSIIFVAINIIVSFSVSDDFTLSYGKGLCYISQPKMIGYLFAMPLGVIILTNVLSFLYVVIKISRASNVSSSSQKNRNLFKIYAKLSSLTGLSWVFGFLYAFTKIEIIEYIFIVSNGGIGILIFISFVCNGRTVEKYKNLIYKSDQDEKQTSRMASTTKTTELNGDVQT